MSSELAPLPRDKDPAYVCEVIEEIDAILADRVEIRGIYNAMGQDLSDAYQRRRVSDEDYISECGTLSDMRHGDLAFQAGLYDYAIRSIRGGKTPSDGIVTRDVAYNALLLFAEHRANGPDQELTDEQQSATDGAIERARVIARFIIDGNTTDKLELLEAAVAARHNKDPQQHKSGPIVAVKGTRVPGTNQVWISLSDPRVAKLPIPREDTIVVAEYPVTDAHTQGSGPTIVTTSETDSPWGISRTVTVEPGSDMWRLSPNGRRLQLFIPPDRTSVLDDAACPGRNVLDLADPTILSLTGADRPNIFAGFEDLHGNPIPVSVAKRD